MNQIKSDKVSPLNLSTFHSFFFDLKILLIVFLVLMVVAAGLTIFFQNLDPNSARYILSSIIQAQAAIISIVISLTLVAVQLTASKYSSRVINVFKKHSSMWFLLYYYIISLSLATFLLFFISGSEILITDKLLIGGVIFASILFVFLLFVLIPYIHDTLDFLKAENILKLLANLTEFSSIDIKNDPFQSIFDVIYGAISIFDHPTMYLGLILAQNKFDELIQNCNDEKEKIFLSKKFSDNLQRTAILLMKNGESENTIQVLDYLKTNFNSLIEKNEVTILPLFNSTNDRIGKYAAEKRIDTVVFTTLFLSFDVGEKIMKIEETNRVNKFDAFLYDVIISICETAEIALKNNIKYDRISFGIERVETFCIFASNKNIIFNASSPMYALTSLAHLAIEQNDSKILDKTIAVIHHICESNLRNQQEFSASLGIRDLTNIAFFAGKNRQISYVKSIKEMILQIAIFAIDSGKNEIFEECIENIAKIKLSFSKEFKNDTSIDAFDFLSGINSGSTIYDQELQAQKFIEKRILNDFLEERQDILNPPE